MKGPLDSLIEGEVDRSSPFQDTTGGPSLIPAAPKKFKLRHVLRKLFRRNKSRTVKVKAADPRQVKLILYSWGVAVFVILAGLAIFRYFSPDAAEILRKAEAAVDRGDNTEAINQYDKFLNTYPKVGEADEVRAAPRIGRASRDRPGGGRIGRLAGRARGAQKDVASLPKGASPDLLQKVGAALARIGEGLAKQAQAKPDESSVERCAESRTLSTTTSPPMSSPWKCLRESTSH